jgi:hypothetical protein
MRPSLQFLCLLAALMTAQVAGCSDPSGPPTTGTLEVTTTISGEPDTLAGIGPNCGPDRAPPGTVHIAAGTQTTLAIAVRCGRADAGVITVVVNSTLINAGAIRSFNAVLDRLRAMPVPSNGSASFIAVPAGLHAVRLDVPTYCSVGGFSPAPNPVAVAVPVNGMATVRFSVLCIG